MKTPEQCTGLNDIREAIDDIDRSIVSLLGDRLRYVYAAANFKPTEESVAAPDRVAMMMVDRRAWAEKHGLSADFVAGLFKDITDWYIATQTAHWRAKRGS